MNTQPNSDESFYAELDRHNVSRGWCTALGIVWISIIIFMAGLIGVVYIVRPSSIHSFHFIAKLNSLGVVRLYSSKNIDTITLTVHISDPQLTEMLRQQNITSAKDLQVHILQGRIEVTGITATSPNWPVYVAFRPEVSTGGTIHLVLLDTTVAGVRLLPVVNQQMRDSVARAMQNYVATQVQGTITAIALTEGDMAVQVAAGH